jgi:thiosulfate reductase cytochrome b subunit
MIPEFFKDTAGKLSMIRLLSFLCVLTGLFLAVLTGLKVYYMQPVHTGSDTIPIDTGFITSMTFLIIGLITVGMGIKTTQKWKEQELATENTNGEKK